MENELSRAHIEASRRLYLPTPKFYGLSEPGKPPPFKSQPVSCSDSESRCIQSLLNVHSEIDKITQDLQLALRLHIGSRNTKRQSLATT